MEHPSMTRSPIRHVTFDCADPMTLAAFWSQVTGWPVDAESGPGDDEVGVMAPDPLPMLLFIRVPEAKSVKNRVHLDIGPPAHTRDEEVERLTGLGGRVLLDHRTREGRGWVVMADPEGNEFCVETSDTERAAFSS
jgi:predicted enzyme related to lactoylglutathione lyase